MATTTESAQFLHLMAVMSPAFPIGSFAYSHGLEWAIDTSEIDVLDWITSLVRHGSAWNDAVLFSVAYDPDDTKRLDIDELALALAASRERYLETTDLGQSCAKAVATLAGREALPYISYPVVLAAYCSDMGISKRSSLLAFMQAFGADKRIGNYGCTYACDS
jgi:urease accessory protein